MEARGKIDLPSGAQPLGLGGGERRKLHGELRRRSHERVDGVDPTGALVGKTVVGRDVGFEIENRCAVDEVALAKNERAALDGDELHGRQADGIGPMG